MINLSGCILLPPEVAKIFQIRKIQSLQFFVMTDGQRYRGTTIQTDIHLPPLDKRLRPIISSICGPNNSVRVDCTALKSEENLSEMSF